MIDFIIRRILYSIVLLILVSFFGFLIIELPPGDFLTQHIAELQARGDRSAELRADQLRIRYGLDRPMLERYWIWISNFVQGDFGRSFHYDRPVRELIGQRIGLTAMLAFTSLVFTWALAIPIGIYSATRQYSVGDQIFTTIAFIGLGTPPFLLALIVMFISVYYFNQNVGVLFSPEYQRAPWSIGKFIDLLRHMWIPALIIAVTGTAGLIRIMRGNLLDTLGQPFVQAARARGLKERDVVWKHAVRIAINPLITILGTSLPVLISGTVLVEIVLNLPTTGPMLVESLLKMDMYLAGTFIVFLTMMLLVGNLIADLLLAWADPRIRYD